MDDMCLKWCHSHTFLILFAFPKTTGMLKKICELAKRVQMREYLCSSWKKYKRCHVGDHFQLRCSLVWEMKSRCLAVFVNNMSRWRLYNAVAAELSNRNTRTCEVCVCDSYLMLCMVVAQAHYFNGISSYKNEWCFFPC